MAFFLSRGLYLSVSSTLGHTKTSCPRNKVLFLAQLANHSLGVTTFKLEYFVQCFNFCLNCFCAISPHLQCCNVSQSTHSVSYFVHWKAWWHPPVKGYMSCIYQKIGFPVFNNLSIPCILNVEAFIQCKYIASACCTKGCLSTLCPNRA